MQAQAFEQLVQRHANLVYNVAYRMLGRPEDAEEVAQEAFLSAYRHWGSFRGEAEVTTWLYRITVNAALMRLRKEKRARELVTTGLEDLEIPGWGENESPERAALNGELRAHLEEGLALLPPDFRAPVVLRDIQGLSNVEGARALGVSLPAFKTRLHRGRVLLRKHLESYVKAPP